MSSSTKKIDNRYAGEAVTTAGDDSVVPTTNEEITLAQTLIQIKAAKPKLVTTVDTTTTTTTRPKDKGVVVQEPSEFRVPQEIKPSSSKDKGKGIMIEPEVPLKRKRSNALDEQLQEIIQANWMLIIRTQKAGKETKRISQHSIAMGSEVQENKEKKEEGREETAKGSRKKMLGRKRAVKEQQEESSKKQKVEEEKESKEVEEDDEVELKNILVVKKDDDIAIDAIPLATKLPVIIKYKLHKEGMLVHYELIRADGSSKRYSSMIRMLQGIDREDLEALWRIVKGMYGDTRPEDEFERVMYGDFRVMFEPNIKSDVWECYKGYRVTTWKMIDSSGVYFVRFDNLHIFMLVERRYHLTPITITNMLNKKLQTDHQNEIRNLKIQKMNIKFRGGLLGLKRLHGFLEVTAAQCCWWKDYDCLKTFYCQEDKDADQRHLWLRYQVKEYTKGIVHDFEQRLEKIFGRQVNRVHVLDFAGLTEEMRVTLADRLRMVYTGDEGQELMSDTKLRLDEADTLCFQLGGARHSMMETVYFALVQKVDLVRHGQNGTATHSHIYVAKDMARKGICDEECLTFGSEDEEYAMASNSGEEDDEKIQDETCLVAQAPNEVCSESSYFSDENSSIDDLALDNEYVNCAK
ncbi:hypothetical protein Tco_0313177 [Tanacetum coccineum]